jgi:competence protein ComEC
MFLIFLIGIFLGCTYTLFTTQKTFDHKEELSAYEWLFNSYEWVVKGVKKREEFYDEYEIQLLKLQDYDVPSWILHLLRVPKNFSLELWQNIAYNGKMYPFEDFNGFSYENYMLSQGIYFSTSTTNIQQISHDTETMKYRLYEIRSVLLKNIFSLFPKDEAVFLAWILFGARENISSDLKEDFNNSWLTHFIAVSGFNITLCILFITYIFWFLPIFLRIPIVIGCIVLFSIFVWLWAPVVRAAIMGILWYIFLQSWNTLRSITLLAFTAVCMSLYSPLSLFYDVSLHLSFLAVIGIIYTQEYFKKLFSWVPEFFAIREACILTLSALSFALPIMMFQFWQVSLLAPFANIAVTWTIPLAMLGGSVTLIFYTFFAPLWEIFGFFTWILLYYDILMVRFFGNIEFALWKIDVGAYGIYLQTLYFIVLIYILSYLHFRTRKQPF